MQGLAGQREMRFADRLRLGGMRMDELGHVGELIAEAQLIYNWDAEPSDVAQLIHPHPTQSEAIREAHLALAGKPLHVHA